MRFHFGLYSALLLLASAVIPAGAQTDAGAEHPFLSSLFASNMVLQRNMKDPVWGWTDPGKEVSVTIGKQTVKATADAQGKWMAKVGPFSSTVTVRSSRASLSNRLVAGGLVAGACTAVGRVRRVRNRPHTTDLR